MYKILDEQYKAGYKAGAIDAMNLLNEGNVFDHLSKEAVEEIQHAIIYMIENPQELSMPYREFLITHIFSKYTYKQHL